MFSIIIPSFNNVNYLKICLKSIEKNSKFNHEIIVNVNDGSDGTLEYIESKKIKFIHTKINLGLCSSVNEAARLSTQKYILYSHDDMYFCPKWDEVLSKEVDCLKTNLFYLSASMIEAETKDHINFNCGNTYLNFDEEKLLKNYNKVSSSDFQGSHWAPHLIERSLWNKIGGFSEEFNPGIGSDPDLNMKLWKSGVRIFKGIANFRVYHFGSISLRKKTDLKRNNGAKTFLKKWGITPKFFKKYYLRSNTIYSGPLSEPKISFNYLLELLICKLRSFFIF